MIPVLKPLIDPLTVRFPAAWAKCQAPHDDGEFNARVCAVLYYEQGMIEVGRNGKRGNPNDLSRDIINWKGTAKEPGPNPDPTGVAPYGGTIIDFIPDHESPAASIGQIYPDPNGPGAWVKPLTLTQIDEQYGSQPQPMPVVPGREEALDELNELDRYYAAPEGLQRPNGLSLNGKPDFEGVAAWYLDVYQQERIKGKSRADARAAYVHDIRHSEEWQARHPGETP